MGSPLLRWILADDQRTARAVRLITCAVLGALPVTGLTLLITENGGVPAGMAFVSAATGFLMGKRRRNQS
jgi:hypothetical protein